MQENNKQFNWYILKVMHYQELLIAKIITSKKSNKKFIRNIIPSSRKYPNMFAGYMLIEMIDCKESMNILSNLGMKARILSSGGKVCPLSAQEVENLLAAEARVKGVKEYQLHDAVLITHGPFVGCKGKIVEIDEEGKTCSVEIEMLGRLTPLNLNVKYIKKDV